MDHSADAQAVARLLARAGRDPDFRAALLADAPAALRSVGLAVAPGVQIKVVEDMPDLVHLVLPPAEPQGPLADDELAGVAAGSDDPDVEQLNYLRNLSPRQLMDVLKRSV